MSATLADPYVIVVHRPTLQAFSLDRNYGVLNPVTTVNIKELEERAIDTWDGYTCEKPAWATYLKEDDFTAYWLF
jgi:hypothetical protein